jgi:hypothetical protein
VRGEHREVDTLKDRQVDFAGLAEQLDVRAALAAPTDRVFDAEPATGLGPLGAGGDVARRLRLIYLGCDGG